MLVGARHHYKVCNLIFELLTTSSYALGSFALLRFVPSESEKEKEFVLYASTEDCDSWPSPVSHSIAQYLTTVSLSKIQTSRRGLLGDKLYILYSRLPTDHPAPDLLGYTLKHIRLLNQNWLQQQITLPSASRLAPSKKSSPLVL